MPYLELEDEVDVDLVELSQLCYRMLPELAATATTQAIEDLSKNTEPTTEDAFRHMCANMLAAYEEFGSAKFTELMSAQLILHPELNAAVTQALQVAGVVAPKHWRNDDELLDVDERQLTAAIGQVVAQAVGAETRSALCHALGRLD